MVIEGKAGTSGSFKVVGRLEPETQHIVFNIRGLIDSPALIDRYIDIYSGIEAPWNYDRLFDYRRADGLIDYADVERLSQWWAERIPADAPPTKVAIVVNNTLDLLRARSVGELFPKDNRQTFFSLDDALTWLNMKGV